MRCIAGAFELVEPSFVVVDLLRHFARLAMSPPAASGCLQGPHKFCALLLKAPLGLLDLSLASLDLLQCEGHARASHHGGRTRISGRFGLQSFRWVIRYDLGEAFP